LAQERGYEGRRPGNPPWNLSRYAVFRGVVSEVDRGSAQQLAGEIDRLYGLITAPGADRRRLRRVLRRLRIWRIGWRKG